MKKLVLILFLSFYAATFAQYKDPGFPTTTVEDGILNHSNSSDNNIFGFLNSDNFEMHHQFDLSYSAFGNQGLALSIYTNSMLYNFSDNLNVQTDISFVNSPYTTLSKDFQNNLNGIYLTRAATQLQTMEKLSTYLFSITEFQTVSVLIAFMEVRSTGTDFILLMSDTE